MLVVLCMVVQLTIATHIYIFGTMGTQATSTLPEFSMQHLMLLSNMVILPYHLTRMEYAKAFQVGMWTRCTVCLNIASTHPCKLANTISFCHCTSTLFNTNSECSQDPLFSQNPLIRPSLHPVLDTYISQELAETMGGLIVNQSDILVQVSKS